MGEPWWKDFKVSDIPKRGGRRLNEDVIAINKTTITFGKRYFPVFKGFKSVEIKQITDDKGDLIGLIFAPSTVGYTLRVPRDRQTAQLTLPKPIRPTFESKRLFGVYRGEIFENPPGYENRKIISLRFEK